jgi:putative membrane protein
VRKKVAALVVNADRAGVGKCHFFTHGRPDDQALSDGTLPLLRFAMETGCASALHAGFCASSIFGSLNSPTYLSALGQGTPQPKNLEPKPQWTEEAVQRRKGDGYDILPRCLSLRVRGTAFLGTAFTLRGLPNGESNMRATFLLVTVPLLFAAPAFAQDASPSSGQPIGQSGKQFFDFASEVNISEVRAGLLAEQKAQSDAVKAFGRLIALDHSELESQLDATAALDHVQVPDKPSSTADQQMDRMKSMSGSQFDRAYMNDMVQGHEKAVSRFQSEKSNTHNPTVLTVASSALPILQQHLALAKAVQASLSSGPAASR